MRILGADTLKTGIKALNAIPSAQVFDGDVCLAVYDDGITGDLCYFYILEAAHGGVENLPTVVVPLDNATTPTPKRWILSGVFEAEKHVLDIFANSLSQASAGTPLVINGKMEFDGDDINFIRQTASPFNVDSNIMVSNLNVEFVGGHRWDELGASSGIITAEESMIMGSTDTNISFAVERFNTTYSLVLDIVNVIDTSPALYNYMITEKTTRGFTVTFSSPIDTPNYKLQYAVLGDNVDYPQYNLLTSLEDQITDIDGNAITVM